ncbi:MAG: hypothetical protein J1D87_02405 [Lachnospiraceae bacterium]|nr:hypothetical protein [Lachnospiraceae bacterium]
MLLQEKIDDINKRLKSLENVSNIVIWGAGMHTCKLFEKTELLSYKIKSVVDMDEKKQASFFFGFTIKSPEKITWSEVDAIVISVPNREKQIIEMLPKIGEGFSGNIITLYDDNENTPFYQLADKVSEDKYSGNYDSYVKELKSRLDVKKWVSEDFKYRSEDENGNRNNKILVGLLHCSETSFNMIHSLYDAFDADELCTPVVILQGKGYSNNYKELEKQMKENEMRYEFDYNCIDWKFDVLIVHHVQLPPTVDIKKIIDNSVLRVAVPMGVISYNGQGINADHIKLYKGTEVFLERSIYDKTPEHIRKEFNCYITGNPKFDEIYVAYRHRVKIPNQFEKLNNPQIKKIILWTTDHNIDFKICTPEVAFDLYANVVFNYLKEHKDIGLIFRPYRTYISELLRDGLLTEEDVKYFRSYCDSSENIVWDDETDYSASYSLADGIIADPGCGIICSALPMMKPMGVTIRWDMDSTEIVSRNQELIDNYYKISSETDMISFIEMVKAEQDSMLENRKELCKKYVTNFDGNNGERIKNSIIEKFKEL